MLNLPDLICRFNTVLIKIPMLYMYMCGTWQAGTKMFMEI